MSRHKGPHQHLGIRAFLMLFLALVLAACNGTAKDISSAPAVTTAPPPSLASQEVAPAPIAVSVPQKLLRVEPVKGFVGDSFTITAEGLQAGQEIEFQWASWEGNYMTQALANSVQFQERTYEQKRVPLGRALPDAQGRVSTKFTVPEDFGEVHDIYAVAEGTDVARGGFRVLRSASIHPTEGPVGTPIYITVKGLGWKPFESTMALRYDNTYTGFISAVSTKGAAAFQIRAAGPAGNHIIQLTAASPGLPFLNNQQSGTAHIPYMDLRLPFTVTEDRGLPAEVVQWPEAPLVIRDGSAIPKAKTQPGISASLDPAAGPTRSRTVLRASGLPPNAEVEIHWVAGLDSDSRGLQSLAEIPVQKSSTGGDGSLSAAFEVPNEWGGWQLVKLTQGRNVLAEVPFYIEWSLVGVTPKRVKAGESFAVQIKGGGWTELDKGIAVTYDNSYIGYACSATSSGDITIGLAATGGPGSHLIDLYPMIYRHKGTHEPEYWNFELPQLTALQDHPGLALGYRLPVFRLAIEIVE